MGKEGKEGEGKGKKEKIRKQGRERGRKARIGTEGREEGAEKVEQEGEVKEKRV